MSQSRQLAAIMFTDIVGYTALMGADEQKAFELLRKNRELQKPIIAQYEGRWIKELGDGVLASFNTVSDAVNAAIKIQEACSSSKEFQLRIGIHQGEVVFEANDIFGDAVNIAFRIQALATPGGIYISESIHNNISNKKEIQTKFVNTETLKNVKDPVRIFKVIIAGQPNKSTLEEQIKIPADKSIAVLPFVNMSNDLDQEYFSDGMAEEILNSLVHLKDLKVAGRTSSFQFKGKNIDLREIGEKLGVSTVLEGSVRKQGNHLRVTAQLISVADGFHLWSEKYDSNMDDIFAIQDEIAMAITENLKIILLEKEKDILNKTPTANKVAYDLYLKGRHFWNKRTREGLTKSIDYYSQAIKEDPQYSLAYAGVADSYSLLCSYHILSPEASMPKAKKSAEEAMKLNPALSEAYEALGHIELLSDLNWEKAEKDYKKAIQLNPDFATARQRYSLLLATKGRYKEAQAEIGQAQKLEPLSLIINSDAALIHLIMGDYEKAIDQCNEVLEIEPNFAVALFLQGMVYEQSGSMESATTNFKRAVEVSNNNPISKAALGHALAITGHKESAQNALQELEALSLQQFVSPYSIAAIHAGLGQSDQVFHWLHKAVDIMSVWMIHLHFSVDPRFTVFKTDTRYGEILKKVGL